MRDLSFHHGRSRQGKNARLQRRKAASRIWTLVGRGGLVLALAAGIAGAVRAQERTGSVRVVVLSETGPVPAAAVAAAGTMHLTDALGVALVTLRAGPVEILVTKAGFAPSATRLEVSPGVERELRVLLMALPTRDEAVTVVASTRSGRRVDDQAVRVEVLTREEIEEKMLMTPGDVVMLLNEMGGLRVQATSPSLGAASVRIQGLRGRYTRLLADGLPLYGEQPGGLGLLQIPPMDLGRVEVIKGVGSALFGSGAMGGVVNLISRRPGSGRDREVLFNQSSRGATDGVLWIAAPLSDTWSATFMGGAHRQRRIDVDGDGWSDLAGYTRAVVRPRVFWDDGKGRSFLATAGATIEDRNGGGAIAPEALDTRRVDVGVAGQTLARGRYLVSARAAWSHARHRHVVGGRLERDRHTATFAEVSVRGAAGRHTWLVGTALEEDRFRPRDAPTLAHAFTTPGVFAQGDFDLGGRLSVSASGRVDRHSRFGWFLSPRVSALVRAGRWNGRLSAGRGFSAPTSLTEETEAAGLGALTVVEPLRAERGKSVSADLTGTFGAASFTLTAFRSRIDDPARVDRTTFILASQSQPTVTTGGEAIGTIRRAPFSVTGTYTYVRARDVTEAGRVDVALTPRHTAGVVAMVESDTRGRLGLEVYVTGRQRLEVNPYRTASEPYVIVGLLAERRVGRWRIFVNGENLTDVRQTRWDPLVRPTRAVDGRWTVDAWAPLDGRVINAGVRVAF